MNQTRNNLIDDLREMDDKLRLWLEADGLPAEEEDRKELISARQLIRSVTNRLLGDNYQESRHPKLLAREPPRPRLLRRRGRSHVPANFVLVITPPAPAHTGLSFGGITRGVDMRRLTALLVLVFALTACGGPSTPTATASGLLSKTGATSSGPAYMAISGSSSNCATGAADADGSLGNEYVDVCVFPSNDQLVSYINSGGYAAGAALIQVGQTALIEVDPQGYNSDSPPASLVQSIASKVGGSVYNGN